MTRPDKAAPPAPDLVKRDFTAPAINHKWCGDLTEVPTNEGKLYLATVEDLAWRRIVGFGLSEHHDAELAAAALKMAVAVRGGEVAGTIFHSDRGSEYTATLFERPARRCGSTNRWGGPDRVSTTPLPRAGSRRWNGSCSPQRRFATKAAEARREVARFIDWYNRIRRHSSCEMKPPIDLRSDPRRPPRRNGLNRGGGVETGLHDRLTARNATQWHHTPGQ